ncbi:MAG TPA: hypothetical protein VF283_17205 [Bryobacteraceae bacterium]
MSSAFPTEFFGVRSAQERPFFWIRPVDEKGFQVEKRFAEAAYQKTRDLRLYRAQELPDGAVRAELVEQAVYAASRAEKSDEVRDARSYVFAAFARLVDERIARERNIEHAPPSELDRRPAGTVWSGASDAANIDKKILRRQALNAMAAQDRWAWEQRLLGFDLPEIAAELNISADCLSTRMRRAIQEASKILRVQRAPQ